MGFGNLGKALANNNFRRNENLSIVAVFDNDPQLIGKTIDGHYVYGMDQLAEIVQEKGITVAISTVPSQYSQAAIDTIVESGITAILNFALIASMYLKCSYPIHRSDDRITDVDLLTIPILRNRRF